MDGRPHRIHARTCLFAGLLAAAALTAADAQAAEPLEGGKLLLTNGVTSVEGSSGGGLASWAVIAGNETDGGIGLSAHATLVVLPDYRLDTQGLAVGIGDRVELSYARQNFNTREVGAALGLGRDFVLNQDIFGAKVRLFGDLVYGPAPAILPQVSVGIQHKRSRDPAVVKAVGAGSAAGTDFTVSATKLFLDKSILANATLRLTSANQLGLLGFGTAGRTARTAQFEGSIAWLLSHRLVVGGEYRTKPDRLAIAREDNAADMFVAYALNRHVTVTAAYVDLGSIATFDGQRGAFLSLQAAF
jgi:hypothetical protein